jgi:hypothetical protein
MEATSASAEKQLVPLEDQQSGETHSDAEGVEEAATRKTQQKAVVRWVFFVNV